MSVTKKPVFKIRILFKSGEKISALAHDFKVKTNRKGEITSLTLDLIEDSDQVLFLDLKDITAIWSKEVG